MKMQLIDNVLRSLQLAKLFHDPEDAIVSFDFLRSGLADKMIAASVRDKLLIYDLNNGTKVHMVRSLKYGAGPVRFCSTHADSALYCSTKVNHTIRHVNLLNNFYIRYFIGHTDDVFALHFSPINSTFLSASKDNTVRIWDLRSHDCQGLVQVPGISCANFDPDGLVFAIGCENFALKLFDLRSFDRAPFATFDCAKEEGCRLADIKFSPDGKCVLLTTNGSMINLVDSFHGRQVQCLTGELNEQHLPLQACFSPDSQYVLAGSSNGTINVWNVHKETEVCKLHNDRAGVMQYIDFHPKRLIVATGGSHVAFWLPTSEEGIVD